MDERITAGECVDVAGIGKYDSSTDTYELYGFEEDRDYCERASKRWVCSIGRRRSDGTIFAAFDGRFYQNAAFECMWLR